MTTPPDPADELLRTLAAENAELHFSFGAPRDLQVSTSFRDVFAEVLTSFLGLNPSDVNAAVLRGLHTPTPVGLFTA